MKKAKRDIFIHANSAQPLQMKLNSIKSEFLRARRFCSNDVQFSNACQSLCKKFLTAGYDKRTVNYQKNMASRHLTVSTNQSQRAIIEIPYIDNHFHLKFTNIIKNLKLTVTVVNKSRNTLRSYLNKINRTKKTWSKRPCMVKDQKPVQRILCGKLNPILPRSYLTTS